MGLSIIHTSGKALHLSYPEVLSAASEVSVRVAGERFPWSLIHRKQTLRWVEVGDCWVERSLWRGTFPNKLYKLLIHARPNEAELWVCFYCPVSNHYITFLVLGAGGRFATAETFSITDMKGEKAVKTTYIAIQDTVLALEVTSESDNTSVQLYEVDCADISHIYPDLHEGAHAYLTRHHGRDVEIVVSYFDGEPYNTTIFMR